MSTLRCPHCGTANRAGSNFCNRCGTDLRTGDATEEMPVSLVATDALPTPEPIEPAELFNTPPIPWDMTVEAALEQAGLAPLADNAELFNGLSDDGETFAAEPTDDTRTEDAPLATAGRLILGVQGLLEPVRISSDLDEASGDIGQPQRLIPVVDVELEQLRRLRGVMTQDPTLLNAPPLTQGRYWPALRMPWLFTLLGLLVWLPLFLVFRRPVGEVHQWPGVSEAYAAIQRLPLNAPVLILWGYDPATADEMDLVALPLMAHLVDRQSQPVIVSLLPNGPASARRLWERTKADLVENGVNLTVTVPTRDIDAFFLPGGATVLPLLAQDLSAALGKQPAGVPPHLAKAAAQPPTLAVVVAATAEEAQQWLERVQPLLPIPVVAFTSAGADPALRPYLDSGQLRGLVSGFDGADAYQQLRERPLSSTETKVYRLQRTLQNWGQGAFLLILVLGNLAALLWPRT
ncbi:MAG: zinc-ribbon domain-containing protein [Caldilineaceae bacterium]